MALNDIETQRVKNEVGEFVERRRPPPHIRPKLDLGYRISGQSVEIVEIRPVWRGPPGETRAHGVAKATYVRRHDHWKVFWLRADLKWHPYPPAPRVDKLGQFLALVDEDKHHCFFG